MTRNRKHRNSSYKILEFSDTGDYEAEYSDDVYYSDDENSWSQEKSFRSKFKWFIPIAVLLLGGAVAANITINSGARTEFGQGVVGTANGCASDLQLSPVTSFYNQTDGLVVDHSRFLLEAIDISGIPDSCIGADFIIRVYDNVSGKPLFVTDSGSTGATRLDYVRFSMLAGRDFQIVGAANAYMEILDNSTALSDVSVVFDAGGIEGIIGNYADPRDVYTITIESLPRSP